MNTSNKNNRFKNQLKEYNFDPKLYLQMAKHIAVKNGYDPNKIKFANDGKHKLSYDGVHFGAVSYKDRIIYAWLEINNIVPLGTTTKKQLQYRKRAKMVMEKTNNMNSPASLSYFILW